MGLTAWNGQDSYAVSCVGYDEIDQTALRYAAGEFQAGGSGALLFSVHVPELDSPAIVEINTALYAATVHIKYTGVPSLAFDAASFSR